jgi:flagellin FlaB
VGIGTLIVFIAMVLVAAIAAGVLINTAGFLQSKSEASGQQAGEQVTNRIQVTGVIGSHFEETGSNTKEIGVVEMTVSLAPGAEQLDLRNTTIQWLGPSGTYNLVANRSSTIPPTADGSFGVAPIKDSDESAPVLNDPDDQFVLYFDIGENNTAADEQPQPRKGLESKGVEYFAQGNKLQEGQTVTVEMTTQSGSTVSERLVVPESLAGESTVQL